MTSLADSVDRLGTPEYIQFSDYKQTPLPVCSIVSDRKGLTFYKKWKQADTADRCHNNAFIIYDGHRRLEDAHMKSEKIIKTAGLRMRFSDILNTDACVEKNICHCEYVNQIIFESDEWFHARQ